MPERITSNWLGSMPRTSSSCVGVTPSTSRSTRPVSGSGRESVSGGAGIEQVTFANGSTMDRAQIASAAWFRGSANSEGITGSNGDDTFDGKGGNDTLTGYMRQRHLHLRRRLRQRRGQRKRADAGTDNIKLVGLNASDVEFMRWANNLYITINATGERIQVDNQFCRWCRYRTGNLRQRFHDGPRSDRLRGRGTAVRRIARASPAAMTMTPSMARVATIP